MFETLTSASSDPQSSRDIHVPNDKEQHAQSGKELNNFY
jgi:hypothetical protein